VPLCSVTLDELTILDEANFAHVAAYAQLKRALRSSGCRFRIPTTSSAPLSWDRAVFLNLTFWSAEEGGDVLCDSSISADVLAHVAWHNMCAPQLSRLVPGASKKLSPSALFFAESIASAFDVYLVGRLIANVPDSDFIETQLPIMSEAAEQAGLSESEFAALVTEMSQDPERAFEDMRALLFDVTRALFACDNAPDAQLVLEQFADRRFAPLLHHFQLSNWLLYAHAYGPELPEQERAVLELDATLRAAPVALDWLIEHWVEGAVPATPAPNAP
jgi:hypothetical protein